MTQGMTNFAFMFKNMVSINIYNLNGLNKILNMHKSFKNIFLVEIFLNSGCERTISRTDTVVNQCAMKSALK